MQNYLTFGEHLINRGLIFTDDLKKVLRLQEEQHTVFARLIIDLGFVLEEEILPHLSEHMGISGVSLKDFPSAALSTDRLFPSVDFLFKPFQPAVEGFSPPTILASRSWVLP